MFVGISSDPPVSGHHDEIRSARDVLEGKPGRSEKRGGRKNDSVGRAKDYRATPRMSQWGWWAAQTKSCSLKESHNGQKWPISTYPRCSQVAWEQLGKAVASAWVLKWMGDLDLSAHWALWSRVSLEGHLSSAPLWLPHHGYTFDYYLNSRNFRSFLMHFC